jgi:hypothetical protein
MPGRQTSRERDLRAQRVAVVNESARREVLRSDGRRPLGDNLEQADALIKAAFEIRDAFAKTKR